MTLMMRSSLLIGLLFLSYIVGKTCAEFDHPDCTAAGFSCQNCTTMKYCMDWGWLGGLQHWSSSACLSDSDGQQNPYCDPQRNACVSTPPPECGAINVYKCLRHNDRQPDVKNCRRYFQCDGAGFAEPIDCATGTVYSSAWRKCVYNVDTSENCVDVACKSISDKFALPGDARYYVECKTGSPQLNICEEALETYNANSCSNTCTETEPAQLPQPIPHDCSKYKICEDGKHVLYDCPTDQGFDPVARVCTSGYSTLCNELGILQRRVESIPGMTFVTSIFGWFKLNPYRIVTWLRNDDVVSAIILIVDYIAETASIPPGMYSHLLDLVLNLLPPDIRKIVNIFLDFLPIKNLISQTDKSESMSNERILAAIVEDELKTYSIRDLMRFAEGKSSGELFAAIIENVAAILKIPVDDVYVLLQTVTPSIVTAINDLMPTDSVSFRDGYQIVLDLNKLHFAEDDTGKDVFNVRRLVDFIADIIRNNVKNTNFLLELRP